MPDIAMCNYECERHLRCYRFIANPSFRQSYIVIDLNKISPEGLECKHFWQATDDEIARYQP